MIHGDIQNIYDTKCALAPPSPPRPPAPPPPPAGAFVPAAPSPPPPPPPPAPYFQQRESATETDYDDDCEIVSYATCRGIVADYAKEHGTADVLRLSFAPCEGLDLDEGCFRGCSYGGANGGLFHDLLPDMLAEFNASNPLRCRLSELPYCACANRARRVPHLPAAAAHHVRRGLPRVPSVRGGRARDRRRCRGRHL